VQARHADVVDAHLVIGKAAQLQPLGKTAGAALAAAIQYEAERNDSLSSISRLTQLYDLEKSFSSTLEMDELLPIIGGN